jgi:hypothetical protein
MPAKERVIVHKAVMKRRDKVKRRNRELKEAREAAGWDKPKPEPKALTCMKCGKDVSPDGLHLFAVVCLDCRLEFENRWDWVDRARKKWAGKPKPELKYPADSFEVNEVLADHERDLKEWQAANPNRSE